MGTFLLGLALGILLGLNYRLIVDQLSELFGLPERDLLETTLPVFDNLPSAKALAAPLLSSTESKAPETRAEPAAPFTEDKAAKALNEAPTPEPTPIEEPPAPVAKPIAEPSTGRPEDRTEEPKAAPEPEPKPKKLEVELEVTIPEWIDFPVSKPQIEFSIQATDGRHSLNEVLNLGETETIYLERNTPYLVTAKMVRMTTMLRPFNWSGRYNDSLTFMISDHQAIKLQYKTPPTLRDRASLSQTIAPKSRASP